jgi:hypothetical protein
MVSVQTVVRPAGRVRNHPLICCGDQYRFNLRWIVCRNRGSAVIFDGRDRLRWVTARS